MEDAEKKALERIKWAQRDRWTDIDLSELGLKRIPTEIGGLTELKGLRVFPHQVLLF